MQFIIKPKYHIINKNVAELKNNIYKIALRTINNYKLRSVDIIMNNYCKLNYKLSLKQLAIYLIANCNINIANSDTVVITFMDDNLDQLAKLITYGNSQLYGSKIIRHALEY